jgi:hypothetical protein
MNTQDKDFAPLIWTAVQCYNRASDDYSKKKLKEALKDCLKKWSDQPVKMISEAVQNLNVDGTKNPFDLMWTDRNIFGKIYNKSMIVWEHTTPLNEFYQTLVKCKSFEEIEMALSNYSGVCWITRDEDNLLNKNKFRSNRPGGWESCYSSCGIKLIKK